MREYLIQALTAFAGGMIMVVFVNFCVAAWRYIKNQTDNIWPDGLA